MWNGKFEVMVNFVVSMWEACPAQHENRKTNHHFLELVA